MNLEDYQGGYTFLFSMFQARHPTIHTVCLVPCALLLSFALHLIENFTVGMRQVSWWQLNWYVKVTTSEPRNPWQQP